MDEMNPPVTQKVKFATLGCRLNQYETQAVREQFARAGYRETERSGEADVFVINTCTVTERSDRESRYLVRKCHRDNPAAKIVVTGCYVERNREEVETLPGVTLAVFNRQKSELVELLESCTPLALGRMPLPSNRLFPPLTISRFEGRARAYVKIQDGCNHACAFCKVVLARGPSRSRPFRDILDEAGRLAQEGYSEIILTGIQLGAFGQDMGKRQMLSELLERLSEIQYLNRIRLSSIEPADVTDELIESMCSLEHVCPHLHIPLQSGSDPVLERMNRRYRKDFYLRLIEKIRARVPDFVLTTDVMVGFPGETETQFEETAACLTELEPYKLHIFPYSMRPGTRSARFADGVAGSEKDRRRAVLLELERKLKRRVQSRFLGRTLDLLTEEDGARPGWSSGRLKNYVQVRFPEPHPNPGIIRTVAVDTIEGTELLGRLTD